MSVHYLHYLSIEADVRRGVWCDGELEGGGIIVMLQEPIFCLFLNCKVLLMQKFSSQHLEITQKLLLKKLNALKLEKDGRVKTTQIEGRIILWFQYLVTGILQRKWEEATPCPPSRIELIKYVSNIHNWKTHKTSETEESSSEIIHLTIPETATQF